jgi:hypothetical protein
MQIMTERNGYILSWIGVALMVLSGLMYLWRS